MAGKFEVYPIPDGRFRLRLKASNGQVVAVGEDAYGSKTDAKRAAERIQDAAGTIDEPATYEEVEA